MEKEIKIAGAGIAGLTAAINLKLAGYEVVVFEKNADVGGTHNDFEGLENWTREEDILDFLKKINIDSDFHHKPCREVNAFGPENNKLVVKSDIPFLYLVKRGSDADSLDQYLKRKALNVGVKMEFNKRVEPEDVDIVATGPPKPRGIGYGISFKTDLADGLHAIWDNKLVPYGYAYLITVDGVGTMGVAVPYFYSSMAKKYLSEATERFKSFFQFQITEPREFSGFANAAIIRSKKKIYVGEAGGFQDFLWGYGMRYAFLSGYLAGQAIINKKDYWLMVRQELHPSMKASVVNYVVSHAIRQIGWSRIIKRFSNSADKRKMLQKRYYFSWRKKILYPFAKIILYFIP